MNLTWTNFFDAIYCVSLPIRFERMEKAQIQFQRNGFDATVFEAIQKENGAQGLLFTMKKLFTESLEKGDKNILVFEDDLNILPTPNEFNSTMTSIVEQLIGVDYDLVYLGGNTTKPFNSFFSKNLIKVTDCYSSHAVMYSESAMIQILKHFSLYYVYDSLLVKKVQSHGKSFISYPLLVSQRNGYSDIEKKEVSYFRLIEQRYEKNIESLLKKKCEKVR